MNRIDAAVIDLDNCIADDKWRWPLFDLHIPAPNDRYTRYHDCCDGDMYENREVIERLARRYQLVVFTSRPECVRRKTEAWLRKWNVPIHQLIMRPTGNHEPSTVLKKRMLTEWLDPFFNVVYAIDDRMNILDMYADEGVKICQHVSINPQEYTHP